MKRKEQKERNEIRREIERKLRDALIRQRGIPSPAASNDHCASESSEAHSSLPRG